MATSTNIPTPRRSENRALDQRTVEALQARFDRAALSPDDQLSYDLLLYRNTRAASIFPYRRNAYVFDQMNGAQADVPAFLINIHKVDSEADARAYVSRLQQTGRHIDQAVAESIEREKLGILPPRWVFPQVIEQSRNIITGAPFHRGQGQRPVRRLQDQGRCAGRSPQASKDALIAEARTAMLTSMAAGLSAHDRDALRARPAPRGDRRRHLAFRRRRRAV